MAFPAKKWLGLLPDGWEDLGKIETKTEVKKDKTIHITPIHAYCGTTARIGREGGELFRFCPRCLIKVEYLNQ